MRVVVIGATGTIGTEVAKALERRHEVLRASRKGEVQVDIEDPRSIRRMFDTVGELDAVVCCAGAATFGKLAELGEDDFDASMRSKLMGQVNVVRFGAHRLRSGGSFTLTSGVLARAPMPGTAAVAMVNGAVESFARAAALELDRGVRVNVVSPGWVKETMRTMGMDPTPGMAAADVARTYAAVVEGEQSGETIAPEVLQ